MNPPASHFYALDWVVLGGYFVVTLSVGLAFSWRQRSAEAFTAGNRSQPGWLCGLSIFATFLSSISFLAIPGGAYAGNWNWFVFSLSLPLATAAAVCWFLPYYRASGEVSAYALLERRFGVWARVYASFFYLLTQLARAATVMYLMALPLSVLIGWDIRGVILVTGATVTLYAFLGGLVAVLWTDAIQAVVLIGGALLALAALWLGMPGGPAQSLQIAAEQHKFSLGSFDPGQWAAPTFWVVLLNGLMVNLQNFGIDQNYVQRYIASKSDAAARRSVWLGGLLYVPVSALFLLIGSSLFAWHQAHPEDLAEVQAAVAAQKLAAAGVPRTAPDYAQRLSQTQAALTSAEVGDKVFPHFIGKRLPAGITGLVIAAIFAAGMSTVSTSLNSSATLVLADYYRRFLRPQTGDREALAVLYAGTIAVGGLGTALALLMINIQSALDAWWKLSSVLSGGMVGLFLLGLISRRATSAAAIPAVLAGVLVIGWMTLSQTALWPAAWSAFRNPLHPYLVIVFGSAVILAAGLALAALSPPRSAPPSSQESAHA